MKQSKGRGSYMFASDPHAHFGLSQRKSIESLEITWPSGQVDRLKTGPINRFITVKEGSDIVPKKFSRVRWK